LNVAVVGAGTAGLAASILLSRAGIRVTLYELVSRPAPVGAGLLLQPTGMRVLEGLGLGERILSHGAVVDRLLGTIPSGRVVMDLRYRDAAPEARGVGIHRGALFSALWSAMTTSGVDLHVGSAVSGLEQEGRQVRVRLDGSDDGRAFDAAIIADGTFSRLRGELAIKQRCVAYPWGAWWSILPDRERRFQKVLRQWYRNASEMLGVMPVGRLPAASDDTPHVTLFWSVRCAAEAALRERGLEPWKSMVRTLAPEVEPLLAEVRDASQLLFARYADVRMSRWNDGRIAVIGDAAHATSPQLGQGANLALVDAAVLARCLAVDGDPARALAAYTTARRPHLRYYQWASSALTPIFQSDARIGPWLRDATMGVVCKVAPLRAPMLATLTGARTGFVRGRRPLGLD